MEFFVYQFQLFFLVFSRIMGLILTSTFFSSSSINTQTKMGFVFLVTIVIFPLVYPLLPIVPEFTANYVLLALGEGLVGAAIGISVTIAFSVFQLAGQFFTVQMGFGASEVFDPMSQYSLPLMGQYLYLIFVLVFLGMNGPALILKEIFHSFELVNFQSLLNWQIVNSKYGLIYTFSNLFVVGIKIAIPIIGTLLLISITLGLLGKAAPQMNLLMIGFPISITTGFVVILLLLPAIIHFISIYVEQVVANIWYLMVDISNG
ncbi:MAG: flagellar biosynthetic protein FliR [Spirochaetes bacterium]|nr:flagellar biosynthetic protein FliR [Spirochaetota bacterium]